MRLSGKILNAFDHACDQGDYEVAEQLLVVIERALTNQTAKRVALIRHESGSTNDRRIVEKLIAAHEKLWLLRRVRGDAEDSSPSDLSG